MRLAELRTRVLEVRQVAEALEPAAEDGPVAGVVVSGMLAEQLAKELGAGATPGIVRPGSGVRAPEADVAVHVIAGEPKEGDTSYVRECDMAGIPIVLVQLWPQERWTEPFVLSPFVVECRAGEGFPVAEIAGRMAEAASDARELAERVPALREPVGADAVRSSVLRATILGLTGSRRESSRLPITLEQARMVSQLLSASPSRDDDAGMRALAPPAAGLLAASFALREAAKKSRRVLPKPLADGLVAGLATWGLAQLLRRRGDR